MGKCIGKMVFDFSVPDMFFCVKIEVYFNFLPEKFVSNRFSIFNSIL
jgi:hypothetical protein